MPDDSNKCRAHNETDADVTGRFELHGQCGLHTARVEITVETGALGINRPYTIAEDNFPIDLSILNTIQHLII